jgi:hypothetical protein
VGINRNKKKQYKPTNILEQALGSMLQRRDRLVDLLVGDKYPEEKHGAVIHAIWAIEEEWFVDPEFRDEVSALTDA